MGSRAGSSGVGEEFSIAVFSDSQAAYRHRLGDFTNMIRNLTSQDTASDTVTTLYNCAAPMHTSESILAYLPSLQDDISLTTAPDISIVWLGGNDAILKGTPTGRHVPVATFKDNIRSIIGAINTRALQDGKHTEVVLITPAPLDLKGMPGLRDRYKLSKVFMGSDEDYGSEQATSERPSISRRKSSYSGLASAWRKGGSNAHTKTYAQAIMDLGHELEKEIEEGGLTGISLSTINLWDGITRALDDGMPAQDLYLDGMHLHGKGFEILGELIGEQDIPGFSGGGSDSRVSVANFGSKIPNFLHYLTVPPSEIRNSYGTGQHSSSLFRHALPAIQWTLTTTSLANKDKPLMLERG